MKSLIVKLPAFIVCLVCAFSALETRAGVIISAQDANACAYDERFVADAFYSCLYAEDEGSAQFLNDQSGLTVNYESGVTDFEYVTDFALHSFEQKDEGVLYCGRVWCNQVSVYLRATDDFRGGGYSWLTFDLGEIELITRMALWNGREFPGIDGITIFADDDMDYLNGNAGSLGDFAGDPNAGDTAQIFDILDVSSRYFHLKWERVGNTNPRGSDFVEWGQAWIGEVAFEATRDPVVRSVPAPPTIALLAVGLLGAAFARSRRTR